MPVTTRGAAAPGRRGMTLIELLITLVVLGFVGSALTTAVVRQQRINTRTAAIVDTRSQSQTTIGTLVSELRGISSVGQDIDPADMTSTSITFRAPIGTSVVCAIDGGGVLLRIPPTAQLASGNVLTSFVSPTSLPTANDTAWIYDAGAAVSNPWLARRIVSIDSLAPGLGCPTGAGRYLTAADAALRSYLVALDGSVTTAPAAVTTGAAVRFTRKVRYSFYQNIAGDENWYLGYQTCTGAGCNAVQPVSGPLLPGTANPATTGFRFRYFDVNGLATNVPTQVSRIDIVARSVSRDRVSAGGSSTRTNFIQVDSVSVALRNRF